MFRVKSHSQSYQSMKSLREDSCNVFKITTSSSQRRKEIREFRYFSSNFWMSRRKALKSALSRLCKFQHGLIDPTYADDLGDI